jgi:hypothetical protein
MQPKTSDCLYYESFGISLYAADKLHVQISVFFFVEVETTYESVL